MKSRVITGDCVETMREMPESSVDSVVCDPPYGLEFMGKEWDRLWNNGGDDFSVDKKWGKRPAASKPRYVVNRKCANCGKWSRDKNPCRCANPQWEQPKQPKGDARYTQRMQAWHEAWASEALRVLKPGGYLLAFGGSRTFHRLTCAIEDAGFEIRDCITWHTGSGFPKSLNVSRQIRKTFPDNILCACGQLESQTTPGSQGDYPNHRSSYDEQPRGAQGSGQDVAPSPSGVRAHSHDGRHTGVQDASESNTYLDVGSVHPSSDCSSHREERPSGCFRYRDNSEFDTALSTSHALSKAGHKTETHTPDNGHSDDDLASFSHGRVYSHLPRCTTCQKPVVLDGLGTALKPASEYITMARKPLSEGTVARNVLEHGTGAINVDGCRVGTTKDVPASSSDAANNIYGASSARKEGRDGMNPNLGRWPANLILSHHEDCEWVGVKRVKPGNGSGTARGQDERPMKRSIYGKTNTVQNDSGFVAPDGTEEVEAWECVEGCPVAELDRQSGVSKGNGHFPKARGGKGPQIYGNGKGLPREPQQESYLKDKGGASRFFYVAKASRKERNAGLEGMPENKTHRYSERAQGPLPQQTPGKGVVESNNHPTVKPIALMRYLVRMVTPPGGTVLDPFTGSGSTGCAAVLEGMDFIGIEREEEYVAIAEKRIAHYEEESSGKLFA